MVRVVIANIVKKLPSKSKTLREALSQRLVEMFEKLDAPKRSFLTKVFDREISDLPDPVGAITQMSRLLDGHGANEWFEVMKDESVTRELLWLFSLSPSLGLFAITHPGLIREDLPLEKTSVEEFGQWLDSLIRQRGDQEWSVFLRRTRQRSFIKIALGEWLGVDAFEESVAKISIVADKMLQCALEAVGLSKEPLAVIGMGKWGGMELNYSSDIDLIFVAGNETDMDTLYRYQRRIQDLILLIHEKTAEGWVFRVDTKIRPEGEAGLLIRTVNQYLKHYKEIALVWEYQALLKARFVGGDAKVGKAFIDGTRPFVFNKEVEVEVLLSEVVKMKNLIERDLEKRGHLKDNVKAGSGSIRDVEFTVQFLQMYHGAFSDELHDTGTLPTLRKMRELRVMTRYEADVLSEEYIFLRQLEHLLQLKSQLPIRVLPKEEDELEVLQRKMHKCYPEVLSVKDFKKRYESACHKNREIFTDLFDATLAYLSKRKEVSAAIPGHVQPKSVEAHFSRLESDYFLKNSVGDIVEHLELVQKISKDSPSALSVNTKDEGTTLLIASYYYPDLISKICGLMSMHQLNIQTGDFFSYTEKRKERRKTPPGGGLKLRRPARQYTFTEQTEELTEEEKRKILCKIKVSHRNSPEIPQETFGAISADLNDFIGLFQEGKTKDANERISLGVMESVRDELEEMGTSYNYPLNMVIDNEQHRVYTSVEITSVDSFMFLFEFTTALTTQEYRITRMEVHTHSGQIRDSLYLTDKDGKKIIDEKKIKEPKMTLTLIKHFSHQLPFAPNPELALRQFSSLVDHMLSSEEGLSIVLEDENLSQFARVLGSSGFIWEDFLRRQYDVLFPLMTDMDMLNEEATSKQLIARLDEGLKDKEEFADIVKEVNEFKDREMFRIDLRHIMQISEKFATFFREFTCLADVVITEVLKQAIRFAEKRFSCKEPGTSCICGLGKWGSMELGYASDIELMFIFDEGDKPVVEVMEFYECAAQAMLDIIKAKENGVFELDTRLRPGGNKSSMASSLHRFKQYYSVGGGAENFERQALVRLRAACGDRELRHKIDAHRREYVFGSEPFDYANMMHLRERQQNELVKAGEINIKYSKGGLVDCEYFIQVLQILHANKDDGLYTTNTNDAAEKLRDIGVLSDTEFTTFDTSYRLLRAIINSLRIVKGDAKALVLPERDSLDFQYLVRRLDSFGFKFPDRENAYEDICQKMAESDDLIAGLEKHF